MSLKVWKNIGNGDLLLPELQGKFGEDLYELALETAQKQWQEADKLNLLDRDLGDILGGGGSRGGGGNGNSGNNSTDTANSNPGGNGDVIEKEDVQKGIEDYWKYLQELEEKAKANKDNNWLLYAAIGIGVYSIIK